MTTKKKYNEAVTLEQGVFNQILDGLKADVYVTDIETDEIIFMNQTMKDDFDVENPEGKLCWELLQDGRTERCDFCPVDRLKKRNDKDYVYQWDEFNPLTQRSYRNYDCLMTWIDGRRVHLQQSIDVTALKSANTDELTQFLTRKPGKELLKSMVGRATEDGTELTICLYDVNMLKATNDTYGHAAGDDLILVIAEVFRDSLEKSEFAFRLSGDEFVVVYQGSQKEAQHRVEKVKYNICNYKREYEVSFCFGFAEYIPGEKLTVDELLFLADKRMYEQKRQFHIERNQALFNQGIKATNEKGFTYAQESLYDALVESTDDYIYVCNMKTGVFKYAAEMVEEFDLPAQVIENAAAVWGAKVHPDDKAGFLEANQEISDGRAVAHCVEYRAKNRNGEWVWVRCRGHLELDGNGEPLLFAGFITNLGKKNKVDNLTGLFNKIEFKEQIEHLVGEKQQFSVLILGIDDLKHINDLHNRSFGDQVIRIASQRIQTLLPAGVMVYRLDGDVFGILFRNGTRAEMEGLYRAISHSCERQQSFDGKRYYCTMSGGCVFYPRDGKSYEDLIKYVNYSLEYSKNHGKRRCTYFSQEILEEKTRSLTMIEALRESLENDFNGFHLMYQPLVCAQTGNLTGAEALARWECNQFGRVSPLEFIPLLESTGLIVNVGKWVLEQAIITSKKWIAENPDFVIHVNLSYIQIQESDFFGYLRDIMYREEFPAQNLVLELTESYFIKESQRIKDIFKEIRSTGVRIAMDDFGTGYSTLEILKDSPADIVKIDKAFIRDISISEFDATFIRFVVELCHIVDIEVCLEGVEDQETYDIVRPMGLDFIQGYFFDRPMEEGDFTEKYF